MPEKKEKEVQKEQMVDLDTSGPEVDIALPEEKEQPVEEEVHAETDNKDSDKSDDSSEKSDEQLDATPSEPESSERISRRRG